MNLLVHLVSLQLYCNTTKFPICHFSIFFCFQYFILFFVSAFPSIIMLGALHRIGVGNGMCDSWMDWLLVFVRQNKNGTKPHRKTHTNTLFGNEDNNRPPDTKQLWENYSANRSYIACRLSPGDVCVKYSYIYNDAGKISEPNTCNAQIYSECRMQTMMELH